MIDEAVGERVGEARREAERALEEIVRLDAQLGRGQFDESRHDAAKAHLRAALAALDSLRPAHLAPPPGSA
jgi:hypothetical protein